jgi:dTDP-4-dehydrorhamnose 3,5-epimerase
MAAPEPRRLKVTPLGLPDVRLVEPVRWQDARGFLSETFNHRELAAAGVEFAGVQDNHSLSRQKGTLRGFHFQAPPTAQAKLVRVICGSILDVALDIRRGSPSYGKHVSEVLSAENGRQIYVPVGFAHCFCTLEADTEVLYKVDGYYSRDDEGGVLWNDPDLGVKWPDFADGATLSEKDRLLPRLKDLKTPFVFGSPARSNA